MRRFISQGTFWMTVGLVCFHNVGRLPAQEGTVTGTVTDVATGRPVVGTRIQSLSQAVFGMTNQEGRYVLRGLSAANHTLRVVVVGYTPQQRTVSIAAGQSVAMDFALVAVPFQLDEIVMTATGEQFKRELGNTIGAIDAAQLVATAPTANLSQVLSGRVAGVSVLQSNGTSGTGARIRIRGLSSMSLSNDPLLYIDGTRVAADTPPGVWIGGTRVSKLNDLDPDQIESIEVVKGPSASTLYGTQAANGVIRITTKRGRAGAPAWNFWAEAGTVRDTYTYPGTYFSQAVGSNDPCLPYQQALGTCQIERLHSLFLLNNPETRPFTTGHRGQIGASLSGGTEMLQYFVSAETELETGPLKLPDSEADYLRTERGTTALPNSQLHPNHFNKHSFRINLNARPHAKLDLATSFGFVVNNVRLPQTGDNASSMIGSGMWGSPNPAVVAATDGWGLSRPANSIGKETFRKNDHFIVSSTATWRPLSWFSARGTVGLDYLRYADEQNVLNGQGCTTCSSMGILERQGFRLFNNYIDAKYTADVNATAQFRLTSRLGSKTAAGIQYNRDKQFGVQAAGGVMPPGILALTAGAQKILTENTADLITLGTYVEQQFSLDDRLFLTGAVRVDENSAFGRDYRAAYYPKLAASWVAVDNQDRHWLSSMRFRGALGTSGQSPGPLDALAYLTPVVASLTGATLPGVVLGNLGDPALKPERSREIEAGTDIGLWNNRIVLEATFYDKRTDDALVFRTQPYSIGGVHQRLENVGVVSNRGIEISIGARVIESRALTWDMQLEASGNRNRLVSLAEGVPPVVGFGFKNAPGYPLFGNWQPEFQSWEDRNNDGFIDPSEVSVGDTLAFLGSTVPTRTLAANSSFSLWDNRLRIGVQVDYRGGYSSLNYNDLFQCSFLRNCKAIHDPTAPLEDQAKAIAGTQTNGAYVENGEHIRLREASITYMAPRSLVRWLGAKSGNITLNGRNLALKKFGFKSWDPENVTQSTDAANYSFFQQAQPVIMTLRINLGF